MFLKRLTRHKSGKDHVYWALVESYRTARGCRHRIVSYLGELSKSEAQGWASFAHRLMDTGSTQGQPALFEAELDAEHVPETVNVRVAGVRVEEAKGFGDVWLGLVLWRVLKLDALFERLIPDGKEDVQWALMAAILALARFTSPSSERQIQEHWYASRALPELLGVPVDKVNEDRLYRALDILEPCKAAVEKHLKERLGELFQVRYDLLLYDVTSTYFEGQAAANEQARHGYSRDHRSDCKQICVGLVVTTDGLPLGYEIFDGNRTDVTTVEDIVEVMEAKYGRAERIWVMDRGMVSEDNLAYLRERGGRYIVGTPRSQLKDYEKELMGADWESVYEDLEVKVCASPDGQECFVLCRSAARQAKERAIHERFATRMEKGLLALHDRLAKAVKRPDRARVERQIGRLQERSSRAGRQYDIRLEDDPARPGHLRLSWTFDEALDSWVRLSEGAYLLRTNLTGYSPTEFWKMYMQLVDAEEAFRTLKSDLEIRPIYHQVRPRVHAHVLVAFLAYAMRKTLQQWMQASGLGRGVRTIVEELSQVQYCRVILPTKQGREIELSCVSQPTKHQQVLLQRLGLELPRRLGQPRWRNCVKLECKCSHDF